MLLDRAADLPEAVDRAQAVVTCSRCSPTASCPPTSSSTACSTSSSGRRARPSSRRSSPIALEIAQRWIASERISGALARLAGVADRLADDPDHTTPGLRTLAASATTADHFARLDEAARSDVDLAWRVAVRRAAIGEYDEDTVEALLARDPDPDAGVRALAVRTARPLPDAKAEAWAELFEKRNIPGGAMLGAMIGAFWQPQQDDVLLPFAERFLDEIPALAGGGMLAVFGLMFGMFPKVADDAFVSRAQEMAADPACDPTVRAALLIGTDTLGRMERARAA